MLQKFLEDGKDNPHVCNKTSGGEAPAELFKKEARQEPRPSSLFHQNKRNIRCQEKQEKEDFKKSQDEINHYIEGFFWHRKQFAVNFINPASAKGANQSRKNKQRTIDNTAPHKKLLKFFYIHEIVPFFFSNFEFYYTFADFHNITFLITKLTDFFKKQGFLLVAKFLFFP